MTDKAYGLLPEKVSYSIAEAVRAAGIGRSTLYEAMATGRLKAVKLGSRTLIPAVELRRFIDALPPARPVTGAA
jgi:excisionase family DNA binding protein